MPSSLARGRLAIDSVPGNGTIVSITLPRVRESASRVARVDASARRRRPRRARAAHPRAHRGRRAAGAERLCATVLTQTSARSRPSAIRGGGHHVVERASEIDLLLTDKTMPGFSGLELASLAHGKPVAADRARDGVPR
jgi:hypothetical protein